MLRSFAYASHMRPQVLRICVAYANSSSTLPMITSSCMGVAYASHMRCTRNMSFFANCHMRTRICEAYASTIFHLQNYIASQYFIKGCHTPLLRVMGFHETFIYRAPGHDIWPKIRSPKLVFPHLAPKWSLRVICMHFEK